MRGAIRQTQLVSNGQRGRPDGSINIVDDISGIAQQFGHNCA